jgi:hypothetical protein
VVEIPELGGQRMQDHGSRLVGLDGMAVRSVCEVRDHDLFVDDHQLVVELAEVLKTRCAAGQRA